MMIILSVDPGTSKSAYVVTEHDNGVIKKVLDSDKVDNKDMLDIVRYGYYDEIGIETLASYGKGIGDTTIETAYMIGRMMQIAEDRGLEPYRVLRRHVKKCLLGKSAGKGCNDSAVRNALVEKYGELVHGLTYDRWQAMGVAVTLAEMFEGEKA